MSELSLRKRSSKAVSTSVAANDQANNEGSESGNSETPVASSTVSEKRRASYLQKSKDGSLIYTRRNSSYADNNDGKRTSGMAVDTQSKFVAKRRRNIVTNANGIYVEKDVFCWICHTDGEGKSCEMCTRFYHLNCITKNIVCPVGWICPECERVLAAEERLDSLMRLVPLEHISQMFKFALQKMKFPESEPFFRPVDSAIVPTYTDVIFNPMDFATLKKRIKSKKYGSTDAFLADAKWILHNCIIFNGEEHALSNTAKLVIKICKQQISDVDICHECYYNAVAHLADDPFCMPCSKPHPLVWAKMRGYPFWPAKCLKEEGGMCDVRFFGEHDRSKVPTSQVYLLSEEPPSNMKKSKTMETAMMELHKYIERYREKFGSFEYAQPKTSFNPLELNRVVSDDDDWNDSYNDLDSNEIASSDQSRTDIDKGDALGDEVSGIFGSYSIKNDGDFKDEDQIEQPSVDGCQMDTFFDAKSSSEDASLLDLNLEPARMIDDETIPEIENHLPVDESRMDARCDVINLDKTGADESKMVMDVSLRIYDCSHLKSASAKEDIFPSNSSVTPEELLNSTDAGNVSHPEIDSIKKGSSNDVVLVDEREQAIVDYNENVGQLDNVISKLNDSVSIPDSAHQRLMEPGKSLILNSNITFDKIESKDIRQFKDIKDINNAKDIGDNKSVRDLKDGEKFTKTKSADDWSISCNLMPDFKVTTDSMDMAHSVDKSSAGYTDKLDGTEMTNQSNDHLHSNERLNKPESGSVIGVTHSLEDAIRDVAAELHGSLLSIHSSNVDDNLQISTSQTIDNNSTEKMANCADYVHTQIHGGANNSINSIDFTLNLDTNDNRDGDGSDFVLDCQRGDKNAVDDNNKCQLMGVDTILTENMLTNLAGNNSTHLVDTIRTDNYTDNMVLGRSIKNREFKSKIHNRFAGLSCDEKALQQGNLEGGECIENLNDSDVIIVLDEESDSNHLSGGIHNACSDPLNTSCNNKILAQQEISKLGLPISHLTNNIQIHSASNSGNLLDSSNNPPLVPVRKDCISFNELVEIKTQVDLSTHVKSLLTDDLKDSPLEADKELRIHDYASAATNDLKDISEAHNYSKVSRLTIISNIQSAPEGASDTTQCEVVEQSSDANNSPKNDQISTSKPAKTFDLTSTSAIRQRTRRKTNVRMNGDCSLTTTCDAINGDEDKSISDGNSGRERSESGDVEMIVNGAVICGANAVPQNITRVVSNKGGGEEMVDILNDSMGNSPSRGVDRTCNLNTISQNAAKATIYLSGSGNLAANGREASKQVAANKTDDDAFNDASNRTENVEEGTSNVNVEVNFNGFDFTEYSNKLVDLMKKMCEDMITLPAGNTFRRHLDLEFRRMQFKHDQQIAALKYNYALQMAEMRLTFEIEKERMKQEHIKKSCFNCKKMMNFQD